MLAWNLVKKFVCAVLENESSDMAAKVGVFIRSTKSKDDIIEACNNLIRNSNSGGKIIVGREDKTYRGLKVYLNADDIAQELIAKRFLFEAGDDSSTIHPLITHLTVHNAIFSTTEEAFIEELRGIIQEAMGPVLNVSKIPISKFHPDIGNGNWRVLLDVPEIEDLEVFKKNGLPDNLTFKVPGVHDRLTVTFHCTKCENDGHTRWRCSGSTEDKTKVVSNSAKKDDSIVDTPSRPSSMSFIGDGEAERKESGDTPKNKDLLKLEKIREFESEIGREEVRNYCDSDYLKDRDVIKKEVGESSKSAMKRSLLPERDTGKSTSKKTRISPKIDDDSSENLPKASSTTSDADSLEILYESMPSTPSKSRPHHFSMPSVGGLFTRNTVDDSVSTSNQPVPAVDAIKSELPSTDENDSDSNQGTSRPKPIRQRKKPVQNTPIVIPDRIQKIISEIQDGVLNIEQLTAFFNHVKKKSSPCSFAKMYTTDVAGLKKQLDEIKRIYYMIPDRGTNTEIQFMKWFVNIIDRFDGTPSTRKKKATA